MPSILAAARWGNYSSLRSMNKKALTETDIRIKFITPTIVGLDESNLDVMTQVREEVYFTKGRVIFRRKGLFEGHS